MNLITRLRQHLKALALLCGLGLTLASPGAALADDWRPCANEGDTCRVNGRAVVRYGTDGAWITRSVMGSVACGNDAFGDPAPSVRKRCEAREGGVGGGSVGSGRPVGGGNAGWTFCAAEGEICNFRGSAEVRFGEGNRFTTRTAYNSVRCTVDDFGDPSQGRTKFCEVRNGQALNTPSKPTAGGWGGWGQGVPVSNWRYCAAEGETCRVEGRAQVRFGDGRRYAIRTVDGDVACKLDTFGDPARGVIKHCEVQASAFSGGASRDWSRCADEGERCNFSGDAQVRFGVDGRYIYRDARNGVTCNTDSFGGDPYRNRAKTCEVRRS